MRTANLKLQEHYHRISGRIWYSDPIIINQMILNSVKYVGISRELEVSEDQQFRDYEDLEKGTKR